MDIITSGGHGVGDVLVDEIESSLREFALIEDIQETCGFLSDENSDKAEEFDELDSYGPEFGLKSLGKAISPEEDDPEAALQLLSSEGSTQPAMLLVSAMKGTRKKMGLAPGKLTVKWAADVYDPVPNSIPHAVKSKQKKSRKDEDNNNYKKNGKKGQKSCSKGAGSKDKKQFRKTRSGRPEKGYKTLNTLDEFDYCGSSFLKISQTNFHYVADAL